MLGRPLLLEVLMSENEGHRPTHLPKTSVKTASAMAGGVCCHSHCGISHDWAVGWVQDGDTGSLCLSSPRGSASLHHQAGWVPWLSASWKIAECFTGLRGHFPRRLEKSAFYLLGLGTTEGAGAAPGLGQKWRVTARQKSILGCLSPLPRKCTPQAEESSASLGTAPHS